MSEMVRYKGKLQKVEKLEGESLEQQCQRLIGGELEVYWDSWEEKMNCDHDEEYIISNNEIYKFVTLEREDTEFDIFDAHKNLDETIDIHVMFYNGGCCLGEAVERAINDLD